MQEISQSFGLNLNYCERLVLADILNISFNDTFFLKTELNFGQKREFSQKQELLRQNYPIDYLLKTTKFLGKDFFLIANKVLIPREETQEWVDLAKKFKFNKNSVLFDLACGSGIIGISLANKFKQVYLSDYSNFAVKITQKNIYQNNIKNAQVLKSNLFQNKLFQKKIKSSKKWILTSNLPYLPAGTFLYSEQNRINFEPKMALYSGFDGLKLFRKIIFELKQLKNLPDLAFFELDPRNIKKAQKLAASLFPTTKILKDFNNQNRLLLAGQKRLIKRI
jgi:release factor glutamine methyltransferase